DDGEARLLRHRLDGGRDVSDARAELRRLDTGLEGGLADVQEALRLAVDLADAERGGGVGDHPVLRDADVERDDVALSGLLATRDPVDDHVVRRDARRRGEALVALGGRDTALR